jgi:hypothetical protein
MKGTVAGIVALLFVLVSGCEKAPAEEIKRVTSLDHRVDAILVVNGGDATAPDAMLIYIEPTGAPVSGTPVFVGDHFNGLDFGWSGYQDLTIIHAAGRIFNFTNFWQSSEVDNFKYTVVIHLNESNHPVFKPALN